MNKIVKIVTGSLLAISLFASCSDWLTLEPENDLIKQEFWKSKEEVQATLVGAYAAAANESSNWMIWGDIRSDIYELTLRTPSEYQRFMRNIIVDSGELIKWGGTYKVINYANCVIRFSPNVKKLDLSFSQNEFDQLNAEAYFLRALAYFYLVRMFKDVPYIEEPSESDNQNYFVAKTDELTILNKLITDLERVKDGALNEFPTHEYSKGRVTRGAIYALLADIYLYRGSVKQGKGEKASDDYTAAYRACQTVRGLNYQLLPRENWFENFYPGNSSESIFEFQFNKELGQTNGLLSQYSNNLNFQLGGGFYLVGLFEGITDDVRAEGGSYFPTGTGYNEVWKYVATATSASNITNRRGNDRNDNHIIMYRLPDVMLMEAEARFMLNPSDAVATELVEAVRNRAVLQPQRIVLSESEILDERVRELSFEGKRWFDLLRSARRSAEGKEMMLNLLLASVSASDRPFFESKYKDDNSLYLPIHIDELNINPNLVQNPFYLQ